MVILFIISTHLKQMVLKNVICYKMPLKCHVAYDIYMLCATNHTSQIALKTLVIFTLLLIHITLQYMNKKLISFYFTKTQIL